MRKLMMALLAVAPATACTPGTSQRGADGVQAGAAGGRGAGAAGADTAAVEDLRVVTGTVVAVPAPPLLVLATDDAPDGGGQLLVVARETDFGGVVGVGQEVEVEGDLQTYDRERVHELVDGVLDAETLLDYGGLYMLVVGP